MMDEESTNLLLATLDSKYHAEGKIIAQEKSVCQAVLILFDKLWNDSNRLQAKTDFESKVKASPFYKLIVICYDTQAHFAIVNSHRAFISKAYQRLKEFFPSVTEEQIANHDLSKYSFEQSIGYTARWVHHVNSDNPIWQESLRLHYSCEQHHPEFYYPAVREMPDAFLQESILDMVASRWERVLGGRNGVTIEELVAFDNVYLKRYSDGDRDKVEKIILHMKTVESKYIRF